MKKKILLAVLILVAPSAVAVFVYLNVTSNIPTRRDAAGRWGRVVREGQSAL